MRLQERNSLSVSPTHDHQTLDLIALNHFLDQKTQRRWSVDTRDSTPDVQSQRLLNSPLKHWKDLAIQNERRINSLDPSQDHRMSIPSVAYWKILAEYLDERYWSLIQEKRTKVPRKSKGRRNGATAKVTKQTGPSDEPISSRLRSSHIHLASTARTSHRTSQRRKTKKMAG